MKNSPGMICKANGPIAAILLALLFQMGLTFAGQDKGEQNQVDPSEKGLLLQQLESDTFEKRDEALQRLKAAPDLLEDDEVRKALIGLLKKENTIAGSLDIRKMLGDKLSDYRSYYSRLLDVIVRLQDPRAFAVLLDYPFAAGNVGPGLLLGWITDASMLTHFLAEGNDRQKSGVMRLLNHLSKEVPPKANTLEIGPAERKEIRDILLGLVRGEPRDVRSMAILTIKHFADGEVIRELERIKKEDPYFSVSRRTGEKRYLGREHARSVLSELQESVSWEEAMAVSFQEAIEIVKKGVQSPEVSDRKAYGAARKIEEMARSDPDSILPYKGLIVEEVRKLHEWDSPTETSRKYRRYLISALIKIADPSLTDFFLRECVTGGLARIGRPALDTILRELADETRSHCAVAALQIMAMSRLGSESDLSEEERTLLEKDFRDRVIPELKRILRNLPSDSKRAVQIRGAIQELLQH